MKEVIKTLGATLISLLRVIKHARFPDKIVHSTLIEKPCFILGNGPSLTKDLEKCPNIEMLGDIFCVNDFANTSLYEILQPKHYVLADPAYWQDDVAERLLNLRSGLFHNILKKTTWQLTVFVPFQARHHLQQVFVDAPNIKLCFYNCIPVFGIKKIRFILYTNGLGMPFVQNVLVAALFLSLRLGYKKIFILGADHSWHETLALDEENRVCFRDKHFYETDAKLIPFTMGGNDQTTFKMAELFSVFARMFDGYWKIKEYAEFLGAEIYNASSITYIDAFKRIKVTEISRIVDKESAEK